MFDNILVGVDGRQGGRDAIALAERLLAERAKLALVHVHGGALNPMHAITPGLVEDERRAAQALLERERDEADVRAELVRVEALSAGGGLHQQAERQGADLLVVGSCGRGALGRAMLGNDTRAALNGAPCAVAIASAGYAEHPLPLARIGVGYDGSPESGHALAVARALAAPTRARIEALQVVAIPTYAYTGLLAPAVGESIDVLLSEARERLKAIPGVEGRAVYGLTGEELAAFGDGLDLLVVGSRGYGPVRRLVLGSTSDYLAHHARCSMLVLPRTAVTAAGEAAPSTASQAPGASAVTPAA